MSNELAVKFLQRSDAVDAIGFYVTGAQKDNPTPKLNCRIWDGQFSQADADALCKELNDAIAPVANKWSKLFMDAALEELSAISKATAPSAARQDEV